MVDGEFTPEENTPALPDIHCESPMVDSEDKLTPVEAECAGGMLTALAGHCMAEVACVNVE